jgi:hypothetical protein
MMVDAHIHRVIVVNVNNEPIGIVSSMDVLAAVARAELARSSPMNAGKGKVTGKQDASVRRGFDARDWCAAACAPGRN